MLYSYSGFPEHSFGLFEKQRCSSPLGEATPGSEVLQTSRAPSPKSPESVEVTAVEALPQIASPALEAGDELMLSQQARNMRVKMNMMSGLSIILTLMSILVAFRYVFVS